MEKENKHSKKEVVLVEVDEKELDRRLYIPLPIALVTTILGGLLTLPDLFK